MDIDLKQMVLIGNSLAEEKNIPPEVVHNIIEQAVAAAWRRDYGNREQNVRATINPHRGDVDIYVVYEVVAEVENDQQQISLAQAKKLKPDSQVGQEIEKHQALQKTLGRVAAQTAKQVILQKLKEAERNIVLAEFEERIGSIMVGAITRADQRLVQLEIGQATAIMPPSEQVQEEQYHIGQRLKVLIKTIDREGNRGPQLIVSRSSAKFLEMLFRAEVPEINNEAVVIKGIAREAGVRSKVAVFSSVPNVDPVGTFVGGNGSRVKSVNNEVGEVEKIDIIIWSPDPSEYIINALNPTKIEKVTIVEPAGPGQVGRATVLVNDDQLNIAIGRSGQNVRLAGKLTGYEIDIESDSKTKKPEPPKIVKPHRLAKKEQLEESLLETIKAANNESQKEPKSSND